jgi:hypothetical protein
MMSRALLGFLIAPAIPGLLVLMVAVLRGGFGEGVWALTLILPISYLASAIVGLPLHLLLTHFKRQSMLDYTVTGVIASLAPIAVVIILPWIFSETSQRLASLKIVMVIMVVASGIVSTSFWLIARPDKPHLTE